MIDGRFRHCAAGGERAGPAGTAMKWLSNLFRPLTRTLNTLYPSCREAARLQSASLDRRLPLARRFGLKFHLLFCKWCRRYGKQVAFLRTAMQESDPPGHLCPPQNLSPDARERIKQRLQSESK
jgi:hypothetical protein